jgi:bifunctional non-homologous end joining protein LigD
VGTGRSCRRAHRGGGKIRHPSFKGLRADKEAVEVIREQARSTKSATAPVVSKKIAPRRGAGKEAEVAGVRISHPDRIVYPEARLTKLQVAKFYERIADHILPHLADRPLSLVRCPEGVGAECFYMKHAGTWGAPSLRRVRIREKTKTGEYLIADSLEGLISLVQMGVLEFHTWNSTADDLERPNRIVLDLDPGPEVKWAAVVAAARLLRARLEEMGLASFVKTTGGHGLHVVVPLRPRADWDTALEFSRLFAEAIAGADPKAYTTAFAKKGREGKILIDYMRNSRGSTSVAAFSTRARAAAAVSVPLDWDELSPRRPSDFYDTRRVVRRLAGSPPNPWAAYWTVQQTLPRPPRR